MLLVTGQCHIISQRRCKEVSRIFDGLPPDITFADALRIKRERGDASARGLTSKATASTAKLVRTYISNMRDLIHAAPI